MAAAVPAGPPPMMIRSYIASSWVPSLRDLFLYCDCTQDFVLGFTMTPLRG